MVLLGNDDPGWNVKESFGWNEGGMKKQEVFINVCVVWVIA
jgi:hypothetical protein